METGGRAVMKKGGWKYEGGVHCEKHAERFYVRSDGLLCRIFTRYNALTGWGKGVITYFWPENEKKKFKTEPELRK